MSENNPDKSTGTGVEPRHLSIFESTAALLASEQVLQNLPADKTPILGAVQQMLVALGKGDTETFNQALLHMGVTQGSELFQQVGQMARSLHDSLLEFRNSLAKDSANTGLNGTTIPDAADKLETVIKMTFEAAQKTLTAVENQAALLEEARTEIKALDEKVGNTTGDVLQIRKMLAAQMERIDRLEQMNNEVLMAQSFQDLSGQALKKVIKLVTDLEKNLVSLIQIFGTDSHAVPAEKPQETSKDASLEQGDVDSILSSFGF